jgi:hypothetical protein
MPAAQFAAVAHRALVEASPEGRELIIARQEHAQQIKKLRAGFAVELAATRNNVLVAARAEYGRQIEQFKARFAAENQASRDELSAARAEIESLRANNETYRQRLQACDLVNKLIVAAARGEEITK